MSPEVPDFLHPWCVCACLPDALIHQDESPALEVNSLLLHAGPPLRKLLTLLICDLPALPCSDGQR